MKTYPLMLDVRDRLCVVVGAGAIGLRKARGLAEAGAVVRLVDPAASEARRGAEAGGGSAAELPRGVEVIAEAYHRRQLAGARLVFACTNDRATNERIAREGRSAGALVNVADEPDLCDFYAAATIRRGDLLVAIGTGGAAPALSAELKAVLAEALPERAEAFAAALAEVRRRLRAGGNRPPMAVFRRLAGPAGHRAFLAGGVDALLAMAEADDP
jgi:precorrin-2 dehydrogenase/sirohydrochlorin ferrochelatase